MHLYSFMNPPQNRVTELFGFNRKEMYLSWETNLWGMTDISIAPKPGCLFKER